MLGRVTCQKTCKISGQQCANQIKHPDGLATLHQLLWNAKSLKPSQLLLHCTDWVLIAGGRQTSTFCASSTAKCNMEPCLSNCHMCCCQAVPSLPNMRGEDSSSKSMRSNLQWVSTQSPGGFLLCQVASVSRVGVSSLTMNAQRDKHGGKGHS